MMGADVPLTEDVEVKEDNEVMKIVYMTELAVSLKYGPKMFGEMSTVQEVMHSICTFRNADSRDLVNTLDQTHVQLLLDPVNLVLSHSQCIVQRACKNINS